MMTVGQLKMYMENGELAEYLENFDDDDVVKIIDKDTKKNKADMLD